MQVHLHSALAFIRRNKGDASVLLCLDKGLEDKWERMLLEPGQPGAGDRAYRLLQRHLSRWMARNKPESQAGIGWIPLIWGGFGG